MGEWNISKYKLYTENEEACSALSLGAETWARCHSIVKETNRPLKEALLAGAGLGIRSMLEEATDQETLKGEVCVSSSDVMAMFTLHPWADRAAEAAH